MNICANCKYYYLREYNWLPNEDLCTHPQSTHIETITGSKIYDKCIAVRKAHTMVSKYGGSTGECELYAEKEPEPTLSELIGDFFGSIGDFFWNLFESIGDFFKNLSNNKKKKKREELLSSISATKRVIKINE